MPNSGEKDKKTVFLGSTSADLTDIRAELRRLIPSLGFQIICFEDPQFMKRAGLHAHDICLDNVQNCDIHLLLIDQRFGEEYAGSNPTFEGKSITRAEVEVALGKNKQICTFVRRRIWDEKATWRWNKDKGIEIEPYYAKDTRVFDFIEFITKQSKDNWIDQFEDSIELKAQIKKRLFNVIQVSSNPFS